VRAGGLVGGGAQTRSGSSVHGLALCRTSDLEQHYHHVYRSVLKLLKEQPATPDHGKGRAGLTAATSVGAGLRPQGACGSSTTEPVRS
jgi:hypothetical protein